MGLGTWLSIMSLVAMSIAPVLNKFASTQIGWAWGAALSSFFCFVICVVAQPKTALAICKSRAVFSRSLLLIAVTNSLGLLCQFAAVMRLDPPTLSILGRMYVVFSIALSQFVLKEKCSRLEAGTILMVLSGAVLFCWSSHLSSDGFGIALCLAYCLFFALTHLQVKSETSKTSANSILLVNNLLSAVFLIPLALFISKSSSLGDLHGVLCILGASFFSGWLGLLLFYESLKRIPLVRANFIRTFSPIAGVLVAWPFFPVQFSSIQLVGAATMVSALFIQAIGRK